MLRYRPEIPPEAAEVIRGLAPPLKRSVRSSIRALAGNPRLGEPLHRELEGLLKYRVRRYRIVYRVLEGPRVMQIVAVGERRTVYEELADLVRSSKR